MSIIPRTIYSSKPFNTQRIIGQLINENIKNYTVPPGIIGDPYINFGLWGIFVLIPIGLFLRKIDNSKYNMMITVSCGSWLFHFVRGGFTNPLIIYMYIYISIFIVEKTSRINFSQSDSL